MSPEPVREPKVDQHLLREFTLNIQSLADQIKAAEDNPTLPQFHYGPRYQMASATGPLEFLTLQRDRTKEGDTTLDVLTIDSAGRIVARSDARLTRRSLEGYIASQGLMTGLRDQKLAAPTAVVFFDLVQRQANQLGEAITIREDDANYKELQRLKVLLNYGIDDERVYDQVTAELALATAARPRWQALFGAGGSLGYDHKLEKHITPQPQVASTPDLDIIILAPRLERGLPVVLKETTIKDSTAPLVQTERRKQVLNCLQRTV